MRTISGLVIGLVLAGASASAGASSSLGPPKGVLTFSSPTGIMFARFLAPGDPTAQMFEEDAETPLPVGGLLTNLTVRKRAGLGTFDVTIFVNGSPTNLTCLTGEEETGGCVSPHVLAVRPGDRVSLRARGYSAGVVAASVILRAVSS